ncbi:MAG: S4 domain-containing protein [Candidatus Zixiibacteriota bacterium]
MRIDDFLSTVGVVKRRTTAKELGVSGLLEVNGQRVKPSYDIKIGDIIRIRGSRPAALEVLAIPSGSVAKTQRESFFKLIPVS